VSWDQNKYNASVAGKTARARYEKTDKGVKARSRKERNTLLKKYGLTVSQFDQISKAQNGACAICNEENSLHGKLYVDHEHLTGEVRGLLCVRCNAGIGMFLDSTERLQNAIEYLTRSFIK
jgi:hypothetical protein